MRLQLLQLFGFVVSCHCFASYFITDEFCERPLEPDTVIMNSISTLSTERSVLVYRLDANGEPQTLRNGDLFIAGETLQIALSDVNDEFVFEVDNGAFERGGCNGKRSTIGGKMTILSQLQPVIIVAGWATGHGVVSISEPFKLLPPNKRTNEEAPSKSVSGEHAKMEQYPQDKASENEGKKEIEEKHTNKRKGKFAAALDVNLPMKEKLIADKTKPKFLRGKNPPFSQAATNFDVIWRQYIDSEGFLEQYLTDKLINILLMVAVVLCVYTFYRVFRVSKELAKLN